MLRWFVITGGRGRCVQFYTDAITLRILWVTELQPTRL
jgi:hypothetical protein